MAIRLCPKGHLSGTRFCPYCSGQVETTKLVNETVKGSGKRTRWERQNGK